MDSATWGKIEERKFEVFFCSEKICHANLTWTHGNLRIWKWYFLSILILLEYPRCFFSNLRQRLTNKVAMASVVGTSAMSGLKAGWFAE